MTRSWRATRRSPALAVFEVETRWTSRSEVASACICERGAIVTQRPALGRTALVTKRVVRVLHHDRPKAVIQSLNAERGGRDRLGRNRRSHRGWYDMPCLE